MRFVVYLFTGLLIFTTACTSPSPLKGTDLGKTPAPDFRLTDQTGSVVSLADFRGKVVVLTFLFTHCPDECPLIASKLRLTSDALGATMQQTAFVAVSVDPENDTPLAIAKFVQQHQLEGTLRYLGGTREQLQPVWSAYSLYVAPSPTNATLPSVSHSTRVIVIDPAGNERANFGSDFDPADLAFDVRAVLRE
jgi:protein SCO1